MELCDLNLQEYIHRSTPPVTLRAIPFFVKNAPPPLRAQQTWYIMKKIAEGVKYLYYLDVVHRGIKPANGEPHW